MLYPESSRLRLMPLNYDRMLLYVADGDALDVALGLNPTERVVGDFFREIILTKILPGLAGKGERFVYHTLWSVVLKAENRMVGDISVKGEPNAAGEVEIGYGTYDAFQGRGFMTEAVGCIAGWLLQEPDVKAVIASTLKDNFASIRVLQKSGFVQCGEDHEYLHWRRPRA